MATMATLRDVIEGMQILSRYLPDGLDESYAVSAEHDILCVANVSEGEVIPDDRGKLEKLGWHWDSENDAWSHFV